MAKPQKTSPIDVLALLEQAEGDKRKREIVRLVKQARTDAGMTQPEFAEALGLHRNTVQNWELGKGSPELYFREIEEATEKPPGWFEYQLDPYSRILEMADSLDAINRKLDSLENLIRKMN